MRLCKVCGQVPRCYSDKTSFFESEAQVKCLCGRKTSKHYAFWTSDAADEAREEWERMN